MSIQSFDPQHDGRVGELIKPDSNFSAGFEDTVANLTSEHRALFERFCGGYQLTLDEPQTSAWRQAEIPAGGGIGNARSVARVLSALACGGSVDGITLLSSAGVERVLEEQTRDLDLFALSPIAWGMGFAINDPDFGVMGSGAYGAPISPNRRAFYGSGAGGSLAVVDLDAQVSIGYVMNRLELDPELELQRGVSVARAVYESLVD